MRISFSWPILSFGASCFALIAFAWFAYQVRKRFRPVAALMLGFVFLHGSLHAAESLSITSVDTANQEVSATITVKLPSGNVNRLKAIETQRAIDVAAPGANATAINAAASAQSQIELKASALEAMASACAEAAKAVRRGGASVVDADVVLLKTQIDAAAAKAKAMIPSQDVSSSIGGFNK